MGRLFLARLGIISIFSGGLFGSATTNRAQAQTSSVNSVYAIVGARIEVGNGKVIEKGTVLLRDGLIETVGTDVKVPPEAEIIKGDGLTVYPGFIDTHATRGITVPDAQPIQDIAPDISAGAPPFMREANRKGIRPELRAGDYLTLTDEIAKPARLSGFTTQLLLPAGGTITGTGALVNLNGLPRRDSILRSDVAMNFTFHTGTGAVGEGRGGGYPGSLMGIMAFTRQTLLDARYYQTLQSAWARGGSRRPPSDEALAALQPVLSGTMPVLYDADSENEIRRALKMADEFGLKMMVSGGTEAYKTASLLAQRKVPVLVSLNFGPEPGVTTPAFTPPGGGPGANARPGGGGRFGAGGRAGRGNRPPMGGAGAVPPPMPETDTAAADTAQTTNVNAAQTNPATNQTAAQKTDVPPSRPATNDKPGQDQGKPVPPKQDKEDAVTPNGAPNQANRPIGAAGANAPKDNPDDENSDVPKAVIQERHRKWEEKVANAAKLNQAGVSFAFTTSGVRSQVEFMTNLRRAIKAGLPRDAALRALTIDAARLLGVERQMGTIEPGKTAAIVVMSGDFVQPTTRVRYLFIDKNKFEPDRDTGPLPTLPRRPFGEDDDHE
jgi:imidazolonepropionase-like amidohydrolase